MLSVFLNIPSGVAFYVDCSTEQEERLYTLYHIIIFAHCLCNDTAVWFTWALSLAEKATHFGLTRFFWHFWHF